MVLVRPAGRSLAALIACLVLVVGNGCRDESQNRTRRTQQTLDALKTKSDTLDDATRYLAQMTPLNRPKVQEEVQLYLNKWWQTADKSPKSSVPADLIDGLPPDLRSEAGFANEGDGQIRRLGCRVHVPVSTLSANWRHGSANDRSEIPCCDLGWTHKPKYYLPMTLPSWSRLTSCSIGRAQYRSARQCQGRGEAAG